MLFYKFLPLVVLFIKYAIEPNKKMTKLITNHLLSFLSCCLFLTASAAADDLYDPLEQSACVDVNGFLEQVNIVSVINIKASGNLTALAEYRDNRGVLRGSIVKELVPGEKFDILVNNLGLEADTNGLLCVTTDASSDGEWAGSITIYKPAAGSVGFGDNFDWALYRPISNSLTGDITTSINTIRIGMSSNSLVANWISIGDATPGDNERLIGVLQYRNSNGQVIATQNVDIADGGIAAFGAHEVFGVDRVGTAVFIPQNNLAKYSITTSRYFYDCSSGLCGAFHTAFTLPVRPAISSAVVGGASTLKDEISVIEVVNLDSSEAGLTVAIFRNDGTHLRSIPISIPSYGTRHFVLNSFDPNGALNAETVGSIRAVVTSGQVSINSHFYNVSSSGNLQYAYAAPAAGAAGKDQVSQFNSYINHATELEIVNISNAPLSSDVGFYNFNGELVWLRHALSIPANGTKRITVMLPRNTYGSVIFKNSHSEVAARVYTSRHFQYTIPYISQPSSNQLPNIAGELPAKYVRIMPLGDSITESDVGYSSYRYWLFQHLRNQGIGVDFVGNRFGVRNGRQPVFTDFDQNHQGQSGARADVMLSQLPALIPEYSPDIYLIHLGSNDIFQGFGVDNTVVDLRNIVTYIRSHNPLAVILLAKIIPAQKQGSKIAELSSKIAALSDMSTTSSPVYIVDMFENFSLSADTYDNKHPNNSGDQKMAGKWFNALMEFLFS